MILDTMMAYSEVYEILNLLEEKYKEKVPPQIITFFEEERLKDYEPEIKTNIPLIDQNLKRETIVLLAILNLNYWCDTPIERQELLDEFAKNEKEKQALLEKYNPDTLFNNKHHKICEEPTKQNTEVMVYKENNFVTRLLHKIKQLFKKDKWMGTK